MPTPKDIDFEGLAQFQVDENHQLYWKGQKIRTEVTLPFKIDWAAWIIAISTLIGAIDTIRHWF
jgi:hypothetical protein